jgi:hypothetical protein
LFHLAILKEDLGDVFAVDLSVVDLGIVDLGKAAA